MTIREALNLFYKCRSKYDKYSKYNFRVGFSFFFEEKDPPYEWVEIQVFYIDGDEKETESLHLDDTEEEIEACFDRLLKKIYIEIQKNIPVGFYGLIE